MAKFVNLTPHPITLRGEGGDQVIQPSGEVARVSQTPGEEIGAVNGIPVYSAPVTGAVEGLPQPQDDTVYIVSGMVLAHCQGREDVFGPGTGPKDGAVRNEKGHIVAVTRLIAAPKGN